MVHNPVAPSPAQVLAAAGRPVPTRTAREILAGIGDDRPDVVLLACTGPVVEGLSRSLSSYPHRLVLLTGLPGISVPPSRSALVRRRSCDLFLVHSHRERRSLAELAGILGPPVTLGWPGCRSSLPRRPSWDLVGPVAWSSRRRPGCRRSGSSASRSCSPWPSRPESLRPGVIRGRRRGKGRRRRPEGLGPGAVFYGGPVSAAEWVPQDADIDQLRQAAPQCRGCELWEPATQVVFSAGNPRARMVLVGEQPGDVEDRRGLPFVGPAGKLLQRALDDAGAAREDLYVTNAVKHFRFRQQGSRRIHATPETTHIVACKPWLVAELRAVSPQLVVCLGATAAKALLGADFRVTKQRGEVLERETSLGPRRFLATVHPSSILRIADEERQSAYQGLVDDLRVAVAACA